MNKMKMFLRTIILVLLMLVCTSCVSIKNKNITNDFFFKDNVTTINYSGTYQSAYIKQMSATLSIKRVETLKYGVLYNLKFTNLQHGEINELDDAFNEQIFMNDMELGYFYVKKDKIYNFTIIDGESINDTIDKLKNDVIPEGFALVCSDEDNIDKLADNEDGTHEIVKVDGDKSNYSRLDVYNGDGKYSKNFSWEKGKGLIYYRIGYEAGNDEVILTPVKIK